MAETARLLKTFQVFLTRCVVANAAILRLACSSLSNSLIREFEPHHSSTYIKAPHFGRALMYGGEREIRTPGTRKEYN